MAFVIRRDRMYEGTIISIEIISGFYYKSVRTKTGVCDGGQTTWIAFQRFYAILRGKKKKKDSESWLFLHLLTLKLKSPKWSGHHFCNCNFVIMFMHLSWTGWELHWKALSDMHWQQGVYNSVIFLMKKRWISRLRHEANQWSLTLWHSRFQDSVQLFMPLDRVFINKC